MIHLDVAGGTGDIGFHRSARCEPPRLQLETAAFMLPTWGPSPAESLFAT